MHYDLFLINNIYAYIYIYPYGKCANILVKQLLIFANMFVTGIIYDVIVEPPSVGSTTDEHGHSRPVS